MYAIALGWWLGFSRFWSRLFAWWDVDAAAVLLSYLRYVAMEGIVTARRKMGCMRASGLESLSVFPCRTQISCQILHRFGLHEHE